jgi:hypothetical protein
LAEEPIKSIKKNLFKGGEIEERGGKKKKRYQGNNKKNKEVK